MNIQKNTFLQGIVDSLPICLGYLSVSFAFGIFSVESGLSILEALLISMTNVTSAGQLAAVPIIVSGGAFAELAATQFIINLRYALMSVSLSQKLHHKFTLVDKLIVSFVNTDEVFAVASSKSGKVKKSYMFGLIMPPYLGWALGTFIGAAAGNILPAIVVSSLGVAIYAMFVAIVVPEAHANINTALCVVLAVILSCVFTFVPQLKSVPAGFVIIICGISASAVFAALRPIDIIEGDEND